MAPGKFTTTTTGLVICNQAYLHAQTSDNAFLAISGSGISAAQEEANLLNRFESDIISRHPKLQVDDSVITLTANSNAVTLPTTMMGCQIKLVQFTETGSDYDGFPLTEMSTAELRQMPKPIRDMAPWTVPVHWAWNEDMSGLLLDSTPTTAITLTITFQLGSVAYTAAKTEVSKIPDLFIDVLVFRVSAEFASLMGNDALEGKLRSKSEEANGRLYRALTPINDSNSRIRNFGKPGNSYDYIKNPGIIRRF